MGVILEIIQNILSFILRTPDAPKKEVIMPKNDITIEEYLMGRIKFEELPKEHQDNISIIIPIITQLLNRFYKDNPEEQRHGVSSGYRRKEDHIRIYNQINEKRKTQGLTERIIPWGSKHLSGAAIDIEDKNKVLKEWIKNNESVLESLNLYCEDFSYTESWVHFQIIAPISKKRFFIP